MTLWILFIATMALSLWAAARVKSVYDRFNHGTVLSGLTGGGAAQLILRRSGIIDLLGDIYHLAGLLPLTFAAAAWQPPAGSTATGVTTGWTGAPN